MDPESSFQLIERAQAGDRTALDHLLARYRPRLVRWASGRLPNYARDMTDTEDLVQEVLLGTFRNFKAFDNRGEWALQAYLRRAVMNRVRGEIDRVRHRPVLEDASELIPSAALSPLEEAVGLEVFRQYDAALQQLPEPEREAVIAKLELGCSYKEIALLLEKPSADAARMAVARAIAKVAQLMARP